MRAALKEQQVWKIVFECFWLAGKFIIKCTTGRVRGILCLYHSFLHFPWKKER